MSNTTKTAKTAAAPVIQFDNLGVYEREDEREAVQGIDVGFSNGIVFTVLRAGGANQRYGRAFRKHYTPAVARRADKGTLSDEEDKMLWRNIYADGVIIGVSGAMIGGKEMEFTRENVIALLKQGPDMLAELRNVCDEMMSFRSQEVKDAAKKLGN